MNGNNNSSKSPKTNDILDRIEKENQKQSRYLKLTDGEIRKLQFDVNKIEIKPHDFEGNGKVTNRVDYEVTDIDRPDEGEKTLSMALSTATLISRFMKRNKNILEIERIGSGRNTRYNISAV